MNSLIAKVLRRPFLANLSIIRSISATPTNFIKQIQVTQVKDELVIKGTTASSGKEALLVPEYNECLKNGTKFCPECSLGLEIKHTDVLILSQYLRKDGCMLPRRVTGLCKRMQKRIGIMVEMAHKAGLMPNLKPEHSWRGRKPHLRPKEKGCNTYFDESTIKDPGQRKMKLAYDNFKKNRAYDKVRHKMQGFL